MTVRERMEQEEYDVLAPHAQKAAESQGRLYPEEDNDVLSAGCRPDLT